MRKIFKLIPIASVPLSTLTPIILTSCNNNYEEFVYRFDESNKPEDFEPKSRSSLEKASVRQAQEDLFNAYSKNKKILADELVYQIINSSALFAKLSFTGEIKVSVGEINKVNHTISYKLVVDEVDTNDNTHYHGEIDFKNIKQVVSYIGNLWRCTDPQQMLAFLSLSSYESYLILISNRYDWEVDYKLNGPAAQRLIERLTEFPEIEYYPGGLYTHVISSHLSNLDYVNLMALQMLPLGNQAKQTMYLSEIEAIPES